MMYTVFHTVLTVLGSLALFIFGMKLLSEALQKLAGERMRHYLSTLTSNRWKGLFTGFFITATIQSSSASTVMLIGFVNAGLISVIDSIGIVLGANIGTTVTTWFLTFFGFTVNIMHVVLPLMALSFPFYFSGKSNYKSFADFIFGFSLLFIGLQFLRDALPAIEQDNALIAYLSSLTDHKPLTLIGIALVGFLITLLIQSSTATIALTIVLMSDGYFDFEVAAALVLGENIGTTATANFAAIFANKNAKRVALIHFLFNLFGALTILPFFYYTVTGVTLLADSFTQLIGNKAVVIPVQVSLYHSLFNIFNALIWINLTKYLERIAFWIIKPVQNEAAKNKLNYSDTFITPISEIAIVQASKELQMLSLTIERMFLLLPRLLLEKDEARFRELADEIYLKEEVVDRVESEVNKYLSKISENKLSGEVSRLINGITISVNNLESMADVCYKVARAIEKKNEQKAWFTQEQRNAIESLGQMVQKSVTIMQLHLSSSKKLGIEEALDNEAAINLMRLKLADQNTEDIQLKRYPVQSGNYYLQIVNYYEKIADHAINVVEAINKSLKTS
ncbi:MAG TPA: Na/Pi cotransporter family protein [Bacteroidales bacterium]|nr:Na/Pi cotransporter family protein [Bacteroidales bacterium]